MLAVPGVLGLAVCLQQQAQSELLTCLSVQESRPRKERNGFFFSSHFLEGKLSQAPPSKVSFLHFKPCLPRPPSETLRGHTVTGEQGLVPPHSPKPTLGPDPTLQLCPTCLALD